MKKLPDPLSSTFPLVAHDDAGRSCQSDWRLICKKRIDRTWSSARMWRASMTNKSDVARARRQKNSGWAGDGSQNPRDRDDKKQLNH